MLALRRFHHPLQGGAGSLDSQMTESTTTTTSSSSTVVEFDRSKKAECVRQTSNWATSLLRGDRFDVVDADTGVSDFDPTAFIDRMVNVAPKLTALMRTIQILDQKDMAMYGHVFKHAIYSDVVSQGRGAKLVASALMALGYRCANLDMNSERGECFDGRTKTFGVLSKTQIMGKPLTLRQQKKLLETFNRRPENSYGAFMQIMVLDSAYKEGIDLFDVKYMHKLEPLETVGEAKQVEGRGLRFCGQKGLHFEPNVGWVVHIFTYDSEIRRYGPDGKGHESSSVEKSDKEDIVVTASALYDFLMKRDPRTPLLVEILESACSDAAIDRLLTENLGKTPEEVTARREIERRATETIVFGDGIIQRLQSREVPTLYAGFSIEGGGPAARRDSIMLGHKGSKRPVFEPITAAEIKGEIEINPLSEEQMKSVRDRIRAERHSKFRSDQEEIKARFRELIYDIPKVENKCTFQRMTSSGPSTKSEELDSPEDVARAAIALSRRVGEEEGRVSSIEGGEDDDESFGKKVAKIAKGVKAQKLPSMQDKKDRAIARRLTAKADEDEFVSSDDDDDDEEEDDETAVARASKEAMSKIKEPMINPQVLPLTLSQEFTRLYFRPDSADPKGMLLWQSAGSGKTCLAIATASEFVRQGYKVMYVTRNKLIKEVYGKNVDREVCNLQIRSYLRRNPEILQRGMLRSKFDKEIRDRFHPASSWYQPVSYRVFSNFITGRNKEFLEHQSQEDPLSKVLLIIDEAHHIFESEVAERELEARLDAEDRGKKRKERDSLSADEAKAIMRAIQRSYELSGDDSVRCMFMSATPIIDDPMTMIRILSMCMDNRRNKSLPSQVKRSESEDVSPKTAARRKKTAAKVALWEDVPEAERNRVLPIESMDTFLAKYPLIDGLNERIPSEIVKFQDAISGLISHVDRTYDPSQFAFPMKYDVVVRMPYVKKTRIDRSKGPDAVVVDWLSPVQSMCGIEMKDSITAAAATSKKKKKGETEDEDEEALLPFRNVPIASHKPTPADMSGKNAEEISEALEAERASELAAEALSEREGAQKKLRQERYSRRARGEAAADVSDIEYSTESETESEDDGEDEEGEDEVETVAEAKSEAEAERVEEKALAKLGRSAERSLPRREDVEDEENDRSLREFVAQSKKTHKLPDEVVSRLSDFASVEEARDALEAYLREMKKAELLRLTVKKSKRRFLDEASQVDEELSSLTAMFRNGKFVPIVQLFEQGRERIPMRDKDNKKYELYLRAKVKLGATLQLLNELGKRQAAFFEDLNQAETKAWREFVQSDFKIKFDTVTTLGKEFEEKFIEDNESAFRAVHLLNERWEEIEDMQRVRREQDAKLAELGFESKGQLKKAEKDKKAAAKQAKKEEEDRMRREKIESREDAEREEERRREEAEAARKSKLDLKDAKYVHLETDDVPTIMKKNAAYIERAAQDTPVEFVRKIADFFEVEDEASLLTLHKMPGGSEEREEAFKEFRKARVYGPYLKALLHARDGMSPQEAAIELLELVEVPKLNTLPIRESWIEIVIPEARKEDPSKIPDGATEAISQLLEAQEKGVGKRPRKKKEDGEGKGEGVIEVLSDD